MAPPGRRFNSVRSVNCPFCNNDSVLLIVDFSKKREGKDNVGVCVKKAYKSIMGIVRVKGCGKKFKLEILEKFQKLRMLPPL